MLDGAWRVGEVGYVWMMGVSRWWLAVGRLRYVSDGKYLGRDRRVTRSDDDIGEDLELGCLNIIRLRACFLALSKDCGWWLVGC